ncbi:MAG: DNA-3-methyladenine glycosylase 2 family protein [Verrucomicrobia bacterium]|nr:DNA-3-methyladenine glycosylase 2 family protein [Verrucomicrobiota bacterium]
MIAHSELCADALAHLQCADPVMGKLIPMVGPFALKLKRGRFETLVRAIIAQQISTGAARSIRKRVATKLGGRITPEKLARETPATLRQCGVSSQKAGYLLDLAGKVVASEVRLHHLHRLDDAAIIEELVRVKGIGEWTAQMFLMFCLGRPDVFPHGDLGIRNALKNLYRLREMPDREAAHKLAAPWRPYATIASWYCWRSLELGKETKVAGQWW